MINITLQLTQETYRVNFINKEPNIGYKRTTEKLQTPLNIAAAFIVFIRCQVPVEGTRDITDLEGGLHKSSVLITWLCTVYRFGSNQNF